MKTNTPSGLVLSLLLPVMLVACNSSSDTDTDTDTDTTDTDVISNPVDTGLFLDNALAEEITTESCTLSTGIETTCYSITIAGTPANTGIGPFCPTNTAETDLDNVGIWFDGTGALYDVTGDFIANLGTTYNDPNWQLFDQATGEIYVTDSQVACEAAAQPDVDAAYQNMCVYCDISYFNDGDGGVEQTFLIPVNPTYLDTPVSLSGDTGIALNGVVMALAAPVDDILSNYTIAVFDDCGGHINPVDGYHYHAATGCTEIAEQTDEHSEMIGYALDGYGIYAMANAAGEEHTDLDECRGATDEIRGYHYHSASAEENMFIGCMHGDYVGDGEEAGGPGGPGGPPEDGRDS